MRIRLLLITGLAGVGFMDGAPALADADASITTDPTAEDVIGALGRGLQPALRSRRHAPLCR